MKDFFVFIYNAIAQYIVQIFFVAIITWLGLPMLLPEFQKYSWAFLENLFAINITIGSLLLIFTMLVLLYFVINKLFLKQTKLTEHNKLLWKVNRKTKRVSKIPYCPKHRLRLVSRYIPDNDCPYTEYHCPICNKDNIPTVNSYVLDNLHEEVCSVLLSKYD